MVDVIAKYFATRAFAAFLKVVVPTTCVFLENGMISLRHLIFSNSFSGTSRNSVAGEYETAR